MTYLHWTIYSWQGFNSLECPVMLKTNYRCVQSLNISVDVSKCVENVHKFTQFTHFCPLQKKTCPDSTIYSWPLNVWKIFTNSQSSLTYCPLQKTTSPDWTIYSWQGFNSLVCPLMLKTNYGRVQSVNISVDDAKCVENVHKFTQFTHFLSVTKNVLSWLNNLFMARFQHFSMSSYAKNKLQMCSLTQPRCRRHQICGKFSHINSLHSLLDCSKKWLVFTEQSIHGKDSTH